MNDTETWIRWFETLTNKDVPVVGGKNASLGEMVRSLKSEGIQVPDGFATTAEAYHRLLDEGGLGERIRELLARHREGERSLSDASRAIRETIRETDLPGPLREAILEAYRELSRRYDMKEADVAVRSSATAEDLPEASFAGQQESFLNVQGETALLEACRRCYASLFTERAMAYREAHGFAHDEVALSVGVQKMVRADLASAGVIFTLDTETGFPDVVLITASWGLGEHVVKGNVSPDQYTVYKPLLDDGGLAPIVEKTCGPKEIKMVYAESADAPADVDISRWEGEGGQVAGPTGDPRDDREREPSQPTFTIDTTEEERDRFVLEDEEILQLARWSVVIEEHYGRPMDIEWAKDGQSGELFIVQARPETVQSRRQQGQLQTYRLTEPDPPPLLSGLSVGSSIAAGPVARVLSTDDLDQVEPNSILVTEMTDPDWVPALRQAAAIVTDHGGRTCHAAIVSRELGIPAVVGTGTATKQLETGQVVTVSCAEGDEGHIYAGERDFDVSETDISNLPETQTRLMLNLASPEGAFQWWQLPSDGIGLARMEFIVGQWIKVHPMALVNFDALEDDEAKAQIAELTRRYDDKTEYFVDRLARGIAKLAASQYPEPVIVRMSDFKTNEYAHLIGGEAFEPDEENPMLGWRGASRYYDDAYRPGFALECRALRRVRETMGFTNVAVMIPFCRTPAEADRVLEVMAEEGLHRGENGLELYVMCEVPSNVVLAEAFAERFDGFSIGSNDLTQLVLGVDRDSERLAHLFDERDEAVQRMIAQVIDRAHAAGCKVGICGQAPSDYPEVVERLVDAGIDSMSVIPDSFVGVKKRIAEVEERLDTGADLQAEEAGGGA